MDTYTVSKYETEAKYYNGVCSEKIEGIQSLREAVMEADRYAVDEGKSAEVDYGGENVYNVSVFGRRIQERMPYYDARKCAEEFPFPEGCSLDCHADGSGNFVYNGKSLFEYYLNSGEYKEAYSKGHNDKWRYDEGLSIEKLCGMVTEWIKENGPAHEYAKNEQESVFCIRMNDSERWFKNTSGLDAEGLCRAYAECRLPFVEMGRYGERISEYDYAYIEQGEKLDFSIAFNAETDQITVFDGEDFERKGLKSTMLSILSKPGKEQGTGNREAKGDGFVNIRISKKRVAGTFDVLTKDGPIEYSKILAPRGITFIMPSEKLREDVYNNNNILVTLNKDIAIKCQRKADDAIGETEGGKSVRRVESFTLSPEQLKNLYSDEKMKKQANIGQRFTGMPVQSVKRR